MFAKSEICRTNAQTAHIKIIIYHLIFIMSIIFAITNTIFINFQPIFEVFLERNQKWNKWFLLRFTERTYRSNPRRNPVTVQDLCCLTETQVKLDHKHFYDIIDSLKPLGDLLVANDSRKVLPARIYGIKDSRTGASRVLLLRQITGKPLGFPSANPVKSQRGYFNFLCDGL